MDISNRECCYTARVRPTRLTTQKQKQCKNKVISLIFVQASLNFEFTELDKTSCENFDSLKS